MPGFDRGFKTIHPNCRHVLVPIVWALCSEEEKARYRADAGKPVKGDTRLQKEVERYNRAQEINRQRWADRRQYERYKARLGDDAPKNFSGFRAMKRAGSEKWDLMQLDYKRRTRLEEHPELALPNAAKATAADEKFTKFLFDPQSKRGWPKGVAFESRLGYNISNWEELREQIIKRASLYPATYKGSDNYGDRYEQKIVRYGTKDKPANVVIGWFVSDTMTKMTSAYLKEVK